MGVVFKQYAGLWLPSQKALIFLLYFACMYVWGKREAAAERRVKCFVFEAKSECILGGILRSFSPPLSFSLSHVSEGGIFMSSSPFSNTFLLQNRDDTLSRFEMGSSSSKKKIPKSNYFTHISQRNIQFFKKLDNTCCLLV